MAEKKGNARGEEEAGDETGPGGRRADEAARPGPRPTPNGVTAEQLRQRNQIRAVVLFACAIFLGCLVLIPGDNLWNWAHQGVLGLFGSWALLWPVLIIYVAVITALEKPKGSISGKVWLTVVIIVLFCATGYIFGGSDLPEDLGFGQYIATLFHNNANTGGGVIGGLLGHPLLLAAGPTGAKIIVILLLFVAIMVLTGTTLIGLFRTLKKAGGRGQRGHSERPAAPGGGAADLRAGPGCHRRAIEAQLPAHPVHSGTGSALFPKAEPKKKEKAPNEKLEKLKAVFGFQEGGRATADPQREQAAALTQGTEELEAAVRRSRR